MKIITSFILGLALYATLFYYGCSNGAYNKTPVNFDTVYVKVYDTIRIQGPTYTNYGSLNKILTSKTFGYLRQRDSLRTLLFLANYKIEKVKYYLAIVDRRPTQIKFLKGWVRRAVE